MTFPSIRRLISLCLIVTFVMTMVVTPRSSFAQSGVMGLPEPGTMVSLSSTYVPLMVTGLTIHPENPLLMDFIVSTGNSGLKAQQVKKESDRLIKYFLACLTIPENNQWVNLSPYEKERIVPEDLGQTVLGQDMLAQDYLLKQLTASLIYPEKNLGKNFWDKVYSKARQMYGTTQVPVNTFNKVWILPDTAKVYEHNNTVFVVKSHLKVMLDEDYLAMAKHADVGVTEGGASPASAGFAEHAGETRGQDPNINRLGAQIIREIVLPAIENEVNAGKNFAQLRQIYNSMILAVWFKKNLKQALLNQVYSNKSKVNGVNVDDPAIKEKIYGQYIQAYKKGVFNYIKEEPASTGTTIPRKYFSGGEAMDVIPSIEALATPVEAAAALGSPDRGTDYRERVGFSDSTQGGSISQVSPAMTAANPAMLSLPKSPEVIFSNFTRDGRDFARELFAFLPKSREELSVTMKIGGTSIAGSILNFDGEFLQEATSIASFDGKKGNETLKDFLERRVRETGKAESTIRQELSEQVLDRMAQQVIELVNRDPGLRDRITLVGYSSPGPFVGGGVDRRGEFSEDAVNLPFKKGLVLSQAIEDRLKAQGIKNIRVEVLHDGAAGAEGERSQHGTLRGARNFSFWIWGTGIGGATISNEELFPGGETVNNLLGEVGHHMVRFPNGRYEWVGVQAKGKYPRQTDKIFASYPEVEQRLGGPALAHRFGVSDASKLKGDDIEAAGFEMGQAIGAYAKAIYAQYGIQLDHFILGSGVTNLGQPLLEAVRRGMDDEFARPIAEEWGYRDGLEHKNGDLLGQINQATDKEAERKKLNDTYGAWYVETYLAAAVSRKDQAMTTVNFTAKPVVNEKGELAYIFGTSGIRFPWQLLLEQNPRIIQGLADYLNSSQGEKTIVVGRDTRHGNIENVQRGAAILAANGIPVIVVGTDDDGGFSLKGALSTPVIALLTRRFKARGSINYTASHNPKEDDGIKFSPEDGGAAPKAVTDNIQKFINNPELTGYKTMDYHEAVKAGLIVEVTAREAIDIYVEYFVQSLKDVKDKRGHTLWDNLINYIKTHPNELYLFDSLQGTGGAVADQLLKRIAREAGQPDFYAINHQTPSSDFEQVDGKPNVQNLINKGVGYDSQGRPMIAGAVDGDADRLLWAGESGKIIGSDEIIAIGTYFLATMVDLPGYKDVVKTFVTSDLIKAVVDYLNEHEYELQLSNTAAGFKYVADYTRAGRQVVIGGEDSFHITFSSIFKETWDDGIAASLMGLVIKSMLGNIPDLNDKTLDGYFAYIKGKVLRPGENYIKKGVDTKRTGNLVEDTQMLNAVKTLIAKTYQQIDSGEGVNDLTSIKKVKELVEIEFSARGLPVSEINHLIIGYKGPDPKAPAVRDGIQIIFKDGDRIIVRPSGTEPIGKGYVDAKNPQNVEPLSAVINGLTSWAKAEFVAGRLRVDFAMMDKMVDRDNEERITVSAAKVDLNVPRMPRSGESPLRAPRILPTSTKADLNVPRMPRSGESPLRAPRMTSTVDRAAVANGPGGIDLNSRTLNMQSSGEKVNITFDPVLIAQFKRGDFSGVRIQILDVVPVNLMPLLGLKEDEVI